jgi:hypothetical protein
MLFVRSLEIPCCALSVHLTGQVSVTFDAFGKRDSCLLDGDTVPVLFGVYFAEGCMRSKSADCSGGGDDYHTVNCVLGIAPDTFEDLGSAFGCRMDEVASAVGRKTEKRCVLCYRRGRQIRVHCRMRQGR